MPGFRELSLPLVAVAGSGGALPIPGGAAGLPIDIDQAAAILGSLIGGGANGANVPAGGLAALAALAGGGNIPNMTLA